MGIFSPRQSAYSPPFDGTKPGPTLVGGQSETSEQPAQKQWAIELRRHPIVHRGHAILALVNPAGETVAELNGMAKSRNADTNTGKVMTFGPDGSGLVVTDDTRFGVDAERVGVVATGSHDDIVKGRWGRGLQAAQAINGKNFDYKSHDPSYEIGGDGGQIQNSNSVAYTLGRVMGLDLDSALRRNKMERTFSGWGRDLLDPSYKRYVAPPPLAVIDTP